MSVKHCSCQEVPLCVVCLLTSSEIVEIPGMLEKCNLWDTAFPDAFKLAHEMDPDAQLCLNDFSLIEANNGPKLMKIIQDHLLPHGAPIHCIGIQVRA